MTQLKVFLPVFLFMHTRTFIRKYIPHRTEHVRQQDGEKTTALKYLFSLRLINRRIRMRLGIDRSPGSAVIYEVIDGDRGAIAFDPFTKSIETSMETDLNLFRAFQTQAGPNYR